MPSRNFPFTFPQLFTLAGLAGNFLEDWMVKLRVVSVAVATVVGGLASPAVAQQEAQQIERVTVTGSAIKRIDAETAVPVTIIKADDLKSQGITSVEQIMATIASVQSSQNMASAIGLGTGGVSHANMRGIGADKTLVLLNGYRIANDAVSGAAPDMNMIPFSAIDRIEVLRDGASSLYGTDAIGGVINFITKRDYTGGSLTAGYDMPQQDGGTTRSGQLGFGIGDLGAQGWNVFGTLSFKKRDAIDGDQRDFNKRIVGGLSNSTYPANYQVSTGGAYYSPLAPSCNAENLIPNAGSTGCRIVTPPYVSISPRSETVSGLLKGTFTVSNNLTLGAEAYVSKNEVETRIAPVPYGGYWINPGTTYFPTEALSNPAYSPTFDPYGAAGYEFNNPTKQFPNPVLTEAGGVLVWWRDMINGPRQGLDKAKQHRVLLTAEGLAGGWDYRAAVSLNRTQNDRFLTGGYADGDVIGEGLIRGIINPFGEQTAEAEALIKGAANVGLLSTSIGKVTSFSASASRELGDWLGAGRGAQVAVGTEYRREDYRDFNHREFAVAVSASTGVDPDAHAEGKRNITAAYAELNVPLSKALDLTGSVRHDRYSDSGSSTNPKLSLRYQPSKAVLLRGSVSTGFRAPSLYELNQSTGFTNTGSFNNPVNCPDGVPVDPATAGANCDVQFQNFFGGNPDLKPEKSNSATLGLVFEPFQGASVTVDLWRVKVKDVIGTLAQETLFAAANFDKFKQYFHFVQPGNVLPISSIACRDGATSPSCGYVDGRVQNLGGTRTSGIDLGFQYRLSGATGRWDFTYDGTYVREYEYQDYADGPWNKNVGIYSGAGPVFKWQHNLGLNWSSGRFAAGLSTHYKSGYIDQDPSGTVSSYMTADAFASFSPFKGTTLLVGVRNLTDREPPFSNQSALFQGGGWDSRFYDPVGRTVYVRATVGF
jgi:iron complex outermembrane receptor protein